MRVCTCTHVSSWLSIGIYGHKVYTTIDDIRDQGDNDSDRVEYGYIGSEEVVVVKSFGSVDCVDMHEEQRALHREHNLRASSKRRLAASRLGAN
jgi:hypothetical protein